MPSFRLKGFDFIGSEGNPFLKVLLIPLPFWTTNLEN